MAQTHILRFPRTDSPGSHILLHVTQAKTTKPLELKLIATEQEHLYHATLKQSTIKSLQTSTYRGDLDSWSQILQRTLLPPDLATPPPQDVLYEGLETVAAIANGTLTLTLRRNVGGITQRLGSIVLDEDDAREEVSFPEWLDSAVGFSDSVLAKLERLQVDAEAHARQVAAMKKQLEELVRVKREHEEALVEKFAVLLNEKKLKIRDQQRLLAGAKVGKEDAEELKVSRGSKGRTKGAVGKGKRKADPVSEAEEDEEMVDEVEVEQQEETPQPSDDDATEDEDSDAEDGLNAKPIAAPPQVARRVVSTKPEPMTSSPVVPLRQDLPSVRASQTNGRKAAPAIVEEEEEEETDDELT